ncbi:GNAT family N-acetyltransferase [Pseudonocardia cypriaca]|uniref:L-amino acid N-acyltransferase YncA n=1 Tax=Pseudonocardia cypriaca TaxID=882449 RepID=A0A543FWF8_9PSEU|nr:GNAT family N-acetyltransferase [Pseudonocardia cypriaca]TQM38119.1 L-amino acid N-acyltransferase YncA [Pseudonocardia cypriaca]
MAEVADTEFGQQVAIRVADERDLSALAGLRRAWLEERLGYPVEDPGFEASFAQWWRVELPRRTFWVAEVGSPRSGYTAVGSINVLEIVHMPRPGARGGRMGHVGNAFVLASFADRGVPAALLEAVVEHAKARRYRRLILAPTTGSAPFYRRAGFAPAGEGLLMLDPSTLPSA